MDTTDNTANKDTRENRRLVTISEPVWTEVKVLATRRGVSYSALVEQILADYLTQTTASAA